MPKFRKFLLVIFLNFLLLTLVSGIESSSSLDLKWKYSAPEEIFALEIYDWDNDSYSEVIFGAGNKIYFLGKDGELKNNFTIHEDSKLKKKITALRVMNTTSEKLVVLGLGWMENFPVKESYFDNESKLKEEVLYRKTLNQGEIKIFDEDGKEVKSMLVGDWVRDMWVGDLNNDKNEEIVISTGGYNIFYYEDLSKGENETKKCSDFDYLSYQPTGYDCRLVYVEGLYCYKSCTPINESFPPLITTTTIEELGNDTLGEINLFEESFWQGSLMIFDQNFSLISEKNYSRGIMWGCYASDLYQDLDLEILAVSSNNYTYCLTRNLTPIWEYPSLGEVRYLWVGDLRDDLVDEIITGSLTSSFSHIVGLDRDGKKFLDFRVSLGEKIRGINVENLDIDEEREILLATDKNLHTFSTNGELKFSNPLFGINKLQVNDLDLNGCPDIIITSGNELYCYEFSQEISQKREAEHYYKKAEEFFLRNYTLAKEYAEKAKEIYLEINDSNGVKNAQELILELEEKILLKKENQGDSLYAKSITLMSVEDYHKAKEYAEKAKEIYTEISDLKRIRNCNKLLEEINAIIRGVESTTTTTSSTTTTIPTTTPTTTTLPPATPSGFNLYFVFLMLTLLLIILFFLRKRATKKEEKEEEEELGI